MLTVGIKSSKLTSVQISEKWDSVIYDYMLKGQHGHDFTDITCITKSYSSTGEKAVGLTELSPEGVFAEYKPGDRDKDGEWEYYIEKNKK